MEGILIVNNDGVALKSTLSAELTSQYASLFSQVWPLVRCDPSFRNFGRFRSPSHSSLLWFCSFSCLKACVQGQERHPDAGRDGAYFAAVIENATPRASLARASSRAE